MAGVTRGGWDRYTAFRVDQGGGNIKESAGGRLRWYGHLLRRDEDHAGRHTMGMKSRKREEEERPRKRWKDCVRGDLREKGIDEAEAQNRNTWRRLIRNGNPI
ncbi:uncharacterized protein [Macrobrachium rosenbergii]|uniref:uncharacterized protein n=1 Tax=Macrobrachium rosenbergii TaxID=79674 RepID=UPI0034D610C9